MTIPGVRGQVTQDPVVEESADTRTQTVMRAPGHVSSRNQRKASDPLAKLVAASGPRRHSEAGFARLAGKVATSPEDNGRPERAKDDKQETPVEQIGRADDGQPPEGPPPLVASGFSRPPPPDRSAILLMMKKLVTGLFEFEDLERIYEALSLISYDELEFAINIFRLSKISQRDLDMTLLQIISSISPSPLALLKSKRAVSEWIDDIETILLRINALFFSANTAPFELPGSTDTVLLQEVILRTLSATNRFSNVYALVDAIVNSEDPDNLLAVKQMIVFFERYNEIAPQSNKIEKSEGAGEKSRDIGVERTTAQPNKKVSPVAPPFLILSTQDQNRLVAMMRGMITASEINELSLTFEGYAKLYDLLSGIERKRLQLAIQAVRVSGLIENASDEETSLLGILVNEEPRYLIDILKVDADNHLRSSQFHEMENTLLGIKKLLVGDESTMLAQFEEEEMQEYLGDDELLMEILGVGMDDINEFEDIAFLIGIMYSMENASNLVAIHNMIRLFANAQVKSKLEEKSWNLMSPDERHTMMDGNISKFLN